MWNTGTWALKEGLNIVSNANVDWTAFREEYIGLEIVPSLANYLYAFGQIHQFF